MLAANPQTALRAGGACVRALLKAKENIFKRDHARVSEEQGGVVGHDKRGARHDRVAVTLEEGEILAADLRRRKLFHNCTSV